MVISDLADSPGRGESAFVFDRLGGRLCFDLVNTLENRPGAARVERLERFSDLVSWSVQMGTLDPTAAEPFLELEQRHPERAQAALERARRLREAIYEVLAPLANGRPADQGHMDELNDVAGSILCRSRITQQGTRFSWEWSGPSDDPARLLWSPAYSVAELLTSIELASARQCASESCGWLFMDTTRNRSRRWCDMQVCGNRAKARRHYQRHKKPDTFP